MLHLNGIKRIQSVLLLPNRTPPVLRALHIRKSRRPSKEAQLEPDVNTFPKRVESPWKIGVYALTTAATVEDAVKYAASFGANSFRFYLSSSSQWKSPPLTSESVARFRGRMQSFGYDSNSVLAHGSHLINLGSPFKPERSYNRMLDDLKRCQELGLKLYNFRPGSLRGTRTPHAAIAKYINRAHKEIQGIRLVMHNDEPFQPLPAPQHPERPEIFMGPQFSDLAVIIDQVEDKTRIGVSIDTCEIFAAGHDIRTKEGWDAMISQFDQKIGLEYLCGMILNDARYDCGSHMAIRENIGLGNLGLNTFRRILQDPYTQHIPLILETYHPRRLRKEIEILQALAVTGPGTKKISEEHLKAELRVFQFFSKSDQDDDALM